MKVTRRQIIIRVVLLVFVAGITIAMLLLRDQLHGLEKFGLPGLFILSVLANSTVIIPVPGVVLTSTFAAVFPPIGVAIAAGLGAALGELSGYLAGYSGRLVVENRSHYDQFVEWMRRYGDWTILVLAFLPNPAFDLAGIMAGGLKLPVPRFLVFCAAGKIMKMLVFAYAGGSILRWISMLFQR